MEISNVLAGLAVSDLAEAAEWYERLLGPGSRPMPEVIEWKLPSGGGLQVYEGPERSGQGSCTMVVSDIDEIADRLRELDMIGDAEPVRDDRVDTLMIKDPAGNSIAFAAAHDDTVVQ